MYIFYLLLVIGLIFAAIRSTKDRKSTDIRTQQLQKTLNIYIKKEQHR